jgi:hypothetical protein
MSKSQAPTVAHPDLWDALLDFRQSPGRHAVAQREPRVLFDNLLAVLMLAANRQPDPPSGESPPDAVREGARFFVRHALLRESNDHYALMGLQAGASAAALREHYRLLIRLTHPDFSREADPWPDDAAARVNRAFDVLSSPDQRADFDARRQALSEPRTPTPSRSPQTGPRSPRRLSVYASVLLVLGATGALMLMGKSADDPSLRLSADSRPPSPQLPLAPERHAALATAPRSSLPAPPAARAPAGPSASAPARTDRVAAASEPARMAPPLPPLQAVPREAGRSPAPTVTVTAAMAAPEHTRAAVRPPETAAGSHRPNRDTENPAPVTPFRAPAAERTAPQPEPAAEMPRAADPLALAAAAPPAPSPQSPARVVTPIAPAEAAEVPGSAHVMARLQPVLVDLLHILGTGQSERVKQWAAWSTRDDASASQFASVYRSTLSGSKVTGLGSTRFNLQQTNDRQVVHGTVQIGLQDDLQQTRSASFRLRAHFVNRDGTFQLARLEAE